MLSRCERRQRFFRPPLARTNCLSGSKPYLCGCKGAARPTLLMPARRPRFGHSSQIFFTWLQPEPPPRWSCLAYCPGCLQLPWLAPRSLPWLSQVLQDEEKVTVIWLGRRHARTCDCNLVGEESGAFTCPPYPSHELIGAACVSLCIGIRIHLASHRLLALGSASQTVPDLSCWF